MRKLVILLAGLVISAMLMLPVSADVQQVNGGGAYAPIDCYGSGCGSHGGNDGRTYVQDADSVIIGNGNDQDVTNKMNVYDGTTNQVAISDVDGNGNDVTTTNNNLNINGDQINGANTVSNNQVVSINMESAPMHSTLDTGVISTQVISLYSGEVYVVELDQELVQKIELQKAGDKYKVSVRSSGPVLTYLINAIDVKKVQSKSGAPTYDGVRGVYDHKWVDVTFPTMSSPQMYQRQSTNRWFTAELPEDGRYAMVIDTRTKDTLDGVRTEISPSSIDITYIVEKVGEGTPEKYQRHHNGYTNIFTPLENGRADTSSEITVNDFTTVIPVVTPTPNVSVTIPVVSETLTM